MQTSFTLSNGLTVLPFPFRHNWAQSVIERIGYLSGILRGFSGFEQRFSLRTKPRRKIEYRHQVNNAARLLFESLLAAGHSAKFALPVWADAQRISLASAPTNLITLPTAYGDFEAGSPVMLYRSEFDFEIAEVTAVAANSLTLRTNLSNIWQKTFVVVPCRVASLAASTNLTRVTGDLIETTIEWQLAAGQNSANRLTAPQLATYLGKPVFAPRHDWSENLAVAQAITRQPLDFETGVFFDAPLDSSATAQILVNQIFDSRTAIAEFFGFLDSVRGAQKAFWLQSGDTDFIPNADYSANPGAYVQVHKTGYLDYSANLPNKKTVSIRQPNGAMSYHKIIGTGAPISGFDNLQITPNAYINPAIRIAFLRYCRFDASEIEVAWLTNKVARVAARFQELTTVPV